MAARRAPGAILGHEVFVDDPELKRVEHEREQNYYDKQLEVGVEAQRREHHEAERGQGLLEDVLYKGCEELTRDDYEEPHPQLLEEPSPFWRVPIVA